MAIHLRKNAPRILLPSLVAPLAFLAVPAILAVCTIVAETANPGGGPGDDAPMRAAGLLLFGLFPAMYLFLAAFMASVAGLLRKLNKLSLKRLFWVYGLAFVPPAVLLGWSSPFGVRDQMMGLLVFVTLTAACVTIGAVCWWYLATGGVNREQ